MRHLCLCPALMQVAYGVLTPTDFTVPICGFLWEALVDAYAVGNVRRLPSLDELDLSIAKVQANNDRKFITALPANQEDALADLLVEIYESDWDAVNPERFKAELGSYISWVRSMRATTAYKEAIDSGRQDAARELHLALGEIQLAADSVAVRSDLVGLDEAGDVFLAEGETAPRISTGLLELDTLLHGGPKVEDLGLIIAKSGLGKTNALLHLAATATQYGRPALFISLELPQDEIVRRYYAMAAGFPAHHVSYARNTWPEDVRRRYEYFKHKRGNGYHMMTILDLGREKATLAKVEGAIDHWLRGLVEKYGQAVVDRGALVCLDWLSDSYITPPMQSGKNTQQWQQLIALVAELKHIARRKRLVLWTAGQTNKGGFTKEVITMGDTAGGGGQSNSVDYFIGLAAANTDDDDDDDAPVPAGVSRNAALDLVMTLDKNRYGGSETFRIFRAPTLRLYGNRSEYDAAQQMLEEQITGFKTTREDTLNDRQPGPPARATR